MSYSCTLARCLSTAFLLILAAPAVPVHAQEQDNHAQHWGYSGPGDPNHWGDLDPAYTTCKLGMRQSPINIENATKSDLPAIQFDYKPSPIKIIDNGHTIQVNYDPGSEITVGDKHYTLLQFHFHKPSEESINSRRFDMVIHLVHKDSAGSLAVIALLVKPGRENPTIQTLWNNIPNEIGKETSVSKVTISVADLLPSDHNYYSFAGSLTTPPCSEGVAWMVFKAPIEFSAAQIARFGQIYPMNARPTQSTNGRRIDVSNLK